MIYEPWFHTKETTKMAGKAEPIDIWYYHHRRDSPKIIWGSATVKSTADEKIQALNKEERAMLLLQTVWC